MNNAQFDNDIPPKIFEFRFTSYNKEGQAYDSTRMVKACGIDHAVEKFSEDFVEWGETVPKWDLMNIMAIETK